MPWQNYGPMNPEQMAAMVKANGGFLTGGAPPGTPPGQQVQDVGPMTGPGLGDTLVPAAPQAQAKPRQTVAPAMGRGAGPGYMASGGNGGGTLSLGGNGQWMLAQQPAAVTQVGPDPKVVGPGSYQVNSPAGPDGWRMTNLEISGPPAGGPNAAGAAPPPGAMPGSQPMGLGTFDQYLGAKAAPWQQRMDAYRQPLFEEYNKLMGLQQAQQGLNQTGQIGLGQLGVAQGHLGLESKKFNYETDPATIAMGARLKLVQGMSDRANQEGRELDPESVAAGLDVVPLAMSGVRGQGPSSAPGLPPAAPGTVPSSTPTDLRGTTLLGPSLASKLRNDPKFHPQGKAADVPAMFNEMYQQLGPERIRANWPAIQKYLAAVDPIALERLRDSSTASLWSGIPLSIPKLLQSIGGPGAPGTFGERFARNARIPLSEHFGHQSKEDEANAFLRSMQGSYENSGR